MSTHLFKVDTESYQAVRTGERRAEFVARRYRDVRPGDSLVYYPWDEAAPDDPGDEFVVVRVTHIVRGPKDAVPAGYALLSFELEHAKEADVTARSAGR